LSSKQKILEERIRSVRLIAFDFDGVFTDNKVYVLQDGSEAVCCFRGDGIGLDKIKRLGIQTVIISTEVNPVVGVRSKKLGVRCIQGCGEKRDALEGVARELELSLDQVAFVGNDINDLSCLQAVGLPMVVRDAHPDVIPTVLYQTQAMGGQGAVREICDLFEDVLKGKAARAH
jgi:3-deoxy-D-manno-octulosonate 8-phosphate phosphatase (KDO 8-P phosphatase)